MDPVALTFVMPITAVRASTAEPTTAVLTRALRKNRGVAIRGMSAGQTSDLLEARRLEATGAAAQPVHLEAGRELRTRFGISALDIEREAFIVEGLGRGFVGTGRGSRDCLDREESSDDGQRMNDRGVHGSE